MCVLAVTEKVIFGELCLSSLNRASSVPERESFEMDTGTEDVESKTKQRDCEI